MNCKGTCIDNILTNDTDNVLLSGLLDIIIGAGEHMAIFEFTSVQLNEPTAKEKYTQYYDYSNANVNNFVKKLDKKLSTLCPSAEFTQRN